MEDHEVCAPLEHLRTDGEGEGDPSPDWRRHLHHGAASHASALSHQRVMARPGVVYALFEHHGEALPGPEQYDL
eukprot:7057447-Heterocapsa_arctica.AAC.1